MCQHVAETLGEVITAALPDIKEIIAAIPGSATNPAIPTLETELGQLGTDLTTWTPGDTGATVLEVAQDVLTGFQALGPLVPPQYVALAGLVEGALIVIVNTIEGNNAHATGDTATAAAAHANAVTAAGKIGYHVTPFTIAAVTLDPKHAASEYKKQSAKIHKAMTAVPVVH